MSVLVSKRRESKVEYVTTARELLKHILTKVKKFPKSITFYLLQDVVKYARNCYECVSIANGIYLNKENYELRKKYLQDALNCLNALTGLSGILFDCYHVCITNSGWNKWGELIEKEIQLIKAVMKSDQSRVQSAQVAQ